MAQAETILSSENPEGLEQRIRATWCSLFDAYIEACDKEDWYSALAMYQYMRDLDIIKEEDEGEEFAQSARDWLAKVENPWELEVCY